MPSRSSGSLMRYFAAAVLWLSCSASIAVAEQPVPIPMADLPEPPPGIRELIKAGKVTFEAGKREEPTGQSPGRKVTAETHYRISYNYNSRSRWKVDPQHRRVVITLRFSDIKWQPTHRIWFEKRPITDDFWSNRLVRHEFDHVRISTDPRIAKRFGQLLRDKRTITQSLSAADVVNRRFVDRLVEQFVAATFSEVSELISIRYRELDRATSHGLNPLPADSPLSGLLRPNPSETRNPSDDNVRPR